MIETITQPSDHRARPAPWLDECDESQRLRLVSPVRTGLPLDAARSIVRSETGLGLSPRLRRADRPARLAAEIAL